MSMSINSSFMAYAKSLEGTSLSGYSSLSSKTLQSKAENSKIVTNSSASAINDHHENHRIEEVQDSSNVENTKKKVVSRNSEIFYNNYLLKTNNDKSYEIDGVAFSAEEIDAVRKVVQNAVSPLLGGKLYYDYRDYAQMGIVENSVTKYATENLTEEQAQVVNQSLSGYISNLLDKEENWINSECYIDNTEGVGDTGEMNTYYGVRQSIPQWVRNEMNAELAKFNIHRQGSGSKTASDNHPVDGRTGGLIYCASNKELSESIRSLFANTDITDIGKMTETFKQYKDMMTAAYRAVGFGRTTNDMLMDDTNSFTKQVSNMKAIIWGINKNGVNYEL